MNLDQTIVISPDTLFQEVEGEAVLVNLASCRYFGLDEIGTHVWLLLQQYGLVRTVFEQMLLEYDVLPERLEADLEQLLQSLRHNGLVTLEPAAR
jgi:hypothetical protein